MCTAAPLPRPDRGLEVADAFGKSSRRRNDFAEALCTWLGRKGSGRLGESGWRPQALECLNDHIALWSVRTSAYHVWASGMKRGLKMLAMTFLIRQEPFTHAVEAPSFPKSCPETLSTYPSEAARTRRAWNSSLGPCVRPFCKSFGNPSKVTIFIF